MTAIQLKTNLHHLVDVIQDDIILEAVYTLLAKHAPQEAENVIEAEDEQEAIGLLNAITEGRKTKLVSRETIMQKLKGNGNTVSK